METQTVVRQIKIPNQFYFDWAFLGYKWVYGIRKLYNNAITCKDIELPQKKWGWSVIKE